MEFDFQLPEIGKVLFAIFLGGLIGLERELARKPAGLRTHMLVTGAATLLMVLGDYIVGVYGNSPYVEAIQADPIRIMEAIITGISFLGAGTIFFRNQQETVEGLTTAASILFASGVGITVALNELYLASVLTLVVLLILVSLTSLERRIGPLRDYLYPNPKKKKDSADD